MSCPGCGSDQGSIGRYCDDCIARKKAERAQRTADPFGKYKKEKDVVHGTLNRPEFFLLGGLFLGVMLLVHGMLFGPVKDQGILACIFFAVMALGFVISVASWAWFWQKMMVSDPMWAIGSCIMPCLVYRYAVLNWDESKIPFVTHFAALVLGLVFCKFLSVQMDVSYFEAMGSFVNLI